MRSASQKLALAGDECVDNFEPPEEAEAMLKDVIKEADKLIKKLEAEEEASK